MLSDQNKKMLKIGGGIFVVVMVILLIVLFAKRSSSKQPPTPPPPPPPPTPTNNFNTSISFVYNGLNEKATVSLPLSSISTMTIGSFIGTVLKNSNLADWNKEDIYWDTISINDHKVTIVNGAISPVVFGNLISTLIGQSPASAVILSAVVLQICTDAQLQALQCDPCLAQQAICTSSGPVCVDNQYCPSVIDLVNAQCCKSSPSGLVPSCNENTFTVTCGTCKKGGSNCGEPNCAGYGPVCTATGWTCKDGVTCPTGAELDSCCTGTTKMASCAGGNVVCSSCTGPMKTCPTTCGDYQEPNCGSNGWECVSTCPSAEVLINCCISHPNTYPTCKDGAVTCGSCDGHGLPIPNCPTSCNGQGLVCTATGWICKAGVECPDPEWAQANCCSDPKYKAVCTTENCIQCECVNDQCPTGVYNSCLAGPTLPNCCIQGEQCTNGMCCAPDETGCGTTCCPPETRCNGAGACVAKCGVDSLGNPVLCAPNQNCIMVINGNNQTAYSCVAKPTPETCQYNFLPNTLPAGIDNFYGCYQFPSSDDQTLGYCTSADDSYVESCYKAYSNSTGCNTGDVPNSGGTGYVNCEWRDIVQYMGQATSQANIETRAAQIQTEMGIINHDWYGDYCQSDNGSYQRIVTFLVNEGTTCTLTDCEAQMAQPGIIDVVYNEATQTCIGVQSCNGSENSWSSYMIDNTGKQVPSPYTKNITSVASEFPLCSATGACPLPANSDYVCDPSGLIAGAPVWTVISSNTPEIECTYHEAPPPNLPNTYSSLSKCLDSNCEGNNCCLTGWFWDSAQQKCFINQPPTDNWDGSGAWIADKPYFIAGGGKTTNPASNPATQLKTTNSSVSYCVCDNDTKTWQDFSGLAYKTLETDSRRTYLCNADSSDSSKCTATYGGN